MEIKAVLRLDFLSVVEVMRRFRQLGLCSRCKYYKKKCKKIMDRDESNECIT